jgi:hypothetical protein
MSGQGKLVLSVPVDFILATILFDIFCSSYAVTLADSEGDIAIPFIIIMTLYFCIFSVL